MTDTERKYYLLGQAVRMAILGRGGKKLVGYSYNGVVLPALPEHDESQQYLLVGVRGDYWRLVCTSKKLVSNGPHSVAAVFSNIAAHPFSYTEISFATKYGREPIDPIYGGGSANGIMFDKTFAMWSNYDVLAEDGSVWLAASEPVPVYE